MSLIPYSQGRVRGVEGGGRGNQDGPAATGTRSSVGTGSPATTGRPFRRARNGTVARTCLVIPRHRVVDRSRMAFSKKSRLDTTPEPAANSAISLRRAKDAGPARPNVSWLSGTNRHAPVPVRLYLSRLWESFPLAVAPVSRAAALTAQAANGCVTHMSATIGRPGSSASRSPRSGSRRERGGSCCAHLSVCNCSAKSSPWTLRLPELHPNTYLSISYVFYASFTLTYFIRVCCASMPGLHLFHRAHGDRHRGAALATAGRTPSHISQRMALSTPVQHMPQPCCTMNALACETICKALFAVC